MRVEATAPAKLLLTGEYVVLRGAPALVAALDRRARAVVRPRPGASEWRVTTDTTSEGSVLHWSTRGRLVDGAGRAARDLPATRLLAVVAETMAARRGGAEAWPGLDVRIESGALRDAVGEAKLGLGSSAAVVVALAAALRRARGETAGVQDASLPEDLALHAALQGGRGSGADVAACRRGGVIRYVRTNSTDAEVRPLAWPPGLEMAVVWTGHSASTPRFLDRWEQACAAGTPAFRASTARLEALSHEAARRFEAGQVTGFLEAAAAYAEGLGALGVALGAEILSPAHRELLNVATRQGAVYKPSGAGGGDVGVLLARAPWEREAVARAIGAHGYRVLEIALDPVGVLVRTVQDTGS